MNFIDYVIIALAVFSVGITIYLNIKNKKKGKTSCGCDCANCSRCKGNNK